LTPPHCVVLMGNLFNEVSAKSGRLIWPRFRGAYTSRKLGLIANFTAPFYNRWNLHPRVKARLLTGRQNARCLASRNRPDGNAVSPKDPGNPAAVQKGTAGLGWFYREATNFLKIKVVGLARFELTTSCTPCKRTTKLCYSPRRFYRYSPECMNRLREECKSWISGKCREQPEGCL
jgi:hypothetical protein